MRSELPDTLLAPDEEDDRPSGSALDRFVLVLNRSWIPVHVTSVRRAICLLYQDVAQVIAADTLETYRFEDWVCGGRAVVAVQTTSLPVPVPEVIQLFRYNKIPTHEAPFTRQNLYHRDNYTCQYCERRGSSARMSIDHVLPRSKGGPTTWENCVLACTRCNAQKADRTLKEAGFRLRRKPRRPRWTPYMNLAQKDRLSSWRRFIAKGEWDVGHTG